MAVDLLFLLLDRLNQFAFQFLPFKLVLFQPYFTAFDLDVKLEPELLHGSQAIMESMGLQVALRTNLQDEVLINALLDLCDGRSVEDGGLIPEDPSADN